MLRKRFVITGQVQGVGFRPTVFRVAEALSLTGWVRNAPEGVVVEAQGERAAEFPARLRAELPPLARILTLDAAEAEPVPDEPDFRIRKSAPGTGHQVLISPDTATCPDCLADMADPGGRRHDYPFTNCTNCGPRYTITRSIPYDRPVTSMACFPLCPECRAEYENPRDRRFHAQPNACPACGPRLWLTDRDGNRLAEGNAALAETARVLARGGIAAIKGLGGFHLACDATDEAAVAELRRRKRRPHKPLAVMVPDLDTARQVAAVGPGEEEWLTGQVRPIVLCPGLPGSGLAPGLSPDTEALGIMLPYAPLHHVLLKRYREELAAGEGDRVPALVMTSGNLSEEPIALGCREALERLGDLADVFLLHDRDILIRADDSVLRVVPGAGRTLMYRRARGFTPSPVFLPPSPSPSPTVLGVGPELKCTLCLTKGDQAFVSQHIGDMENLETAAFHREILTHLKNILVVTPVLAVHDLHPDYMTTGLARELGLPLAALQHHFAHVYACLAENRHAGPALGLALDGTGYGEDGTIWGGELLFVDPRGPEHRRLARFAPFLLPGGEAAVREPWRIAQALLADIGRTEPPTAPGIRPWPWLEAHGPAARFLPQMLARRVNCPATSSCGRLFDAVSAMLGLCPAVTYEGQAAILLERAQDMGEPGRYDFPLTVKSGGEGEVAELAELDSRALFRQAVEDWEAGVAAGTIARRFHRGLVEGLADAAAHFARITGVTAVALSGGAMQNLTLARELPAALSARGLTPLVHEHLPPNDACIALGQAFYGQRLLQRKG
jgi:hydrogenase maturation protein HypF